MTKLLTKKVAKTIPTFTCRRELNDGTPKVVVKFFGPYPAWTWFILSAEAIDHEGLSSGSASDYMEHPENFRDLVFFGLVEGIKIELGCVSLKELERIPGLVRDTRWIPLDIETVREDIHNRRY